MGEQTKQKRPVYSDEFKREAVRLLVAEGYSFKAACDAVGVCQQSLRAHGMRSWPRRLIRATTMRRSKNFATNSSSRGAVVA